MLQSGLVFSCALLPVTLDALVEVFNPETDKVD